MIEESLLFCKLSKFRNPVFANMLTWIKETLKTPKLTWILFEADDLRGKQAFQIKEEKKEILENSGYTETLGRC